MNADDILEDFEQFLAEYGPMAWEKINEFLDQERKNFESKYKYKDDVKTRQGWVSVVGTALEKIVERMVQKVCEHYNLRITRDKELKRPPNKILDQVRRNLEILFDEYSLLPDGDIMVKSFFWCKNKSKITPGFYDSREKS